jgi:hypothetical protein
MDEWFHMDGFHYDSKKLNNSLDEIHPWLEDNKFKFIYIHSHLLSKY